VAAAESYIGLVELGVGLIPAGTGSARLAAFASDRAAERHPSQIQAWLWKFFESVAMAAVSTSAPDAQRLGFLMPNARIVMNDERRIHVAREEVIRLSSEGYLPPPVAKQITVLGRPTAAAFAVSIQQYLEGHFISEYDAYLANRLAYVMTGGELSGPQEVPEDYLLDLERQVFLDLLQEDKTRERIEHMLKTKNPLRN
jgi:3-hydroxyacyl-CoA dehydrogenase